MKNSNWTILLFIFLICSCASLDVSDILPDPNQKAEIQLPQSQRSLASDQPLITYCAKETAAASTPEEKNGEMLLV